jgi:hypothetical protein
MPDSAIAAFERYLAAPDFDRQSLGWQFAGDPAFLAGVRKRLGELYEAKGERARAATHYAAFVELWKDAAPELQPKVAAVRRRLASRGAAEPR